MRLDHLLSKEFVSLIARAIRPGQRATTQLMHWLLGQSFGPTVVDLRISRWDVLLVVRSLFCFQGVPPGPRGPVRRPRGLVVRPSSKAMPAMSRHLAVPELNELGRAP